MKTKANQTIFGIFAYLNIFLISSLPLPLFCLISLFIDKKKRVNYWRTLGYYQAKVIVWLCRLDVYAKGLEEINTNKTYIYASNHPSMLDGFILYSILGPKVTSFTAPFKSFQWPFNIWFKKLDFVEVRRDEQDDKKYPKSATKKQALKKASSALKNKTPLIIFPEGHYERLQHLQYIHTGTARLSLRNNIPVVPISIVGLDRVIMGKFSLKPGRVLVTFNQPLDPKPYNKKYPFRKAAKVMSEKIRKEMVAILPKRYLPAHEDKDPDDVAVFIDIDRTVYKGYSQVDFIKYLFKTGEISWLYAFRIFYWLALEKIKIKPHRELMSDSLLLLKSWDVKRLHFLADKFFEEHLSNKLESHILPHIKDHKKKGHKIVLVTEVIHPLARQFQRYFEADAVLDTKLEIKERCYTGKVKYLCYHKDKAAVVDEFAQRADINLKQSYVYADSISDLPMFNLVKHKITVNPDSKLRKIAKDRDWHIL